MTTPPSRTRSGVIARRTWLALAVAAVVGGLAFGLAADEAGRAAASYLVALAVASTLAAAGTTNVRLADRISPNLTLPIAMFSFLLVVVALGLGLALSSPRVVDRGAVATGLVVAAVVWTAGQVARSWVR